MNFIVNRKL